jgi:hypothetical protein
MGEMQQRGLTDECMHALMDICILTLFVFLFHLVSCFHHWLLLQWTVSIFLDHTEHGNFLTRLKAFQKLSDMSFDICDPDKTGAVGKSDLYAGVILVHLNLAKYAGPAACYVSLEQWEVSTPCPCFLGEKVQLLEASPLCCTYTDFQWILFFCCLVFIGGHFL